MPQDDPFERIFFNPCQLTVLLEPRSAEEQTRYTQLPQTERPSDGWPPIDDEIVDALDRLLRDETKGLETPIALADSKGRLESLGGRPWLPLPMARDVDGEPPLLLRHTFTLDNCPNVRIEDLTGSDLTNAVGIVGIAVRALNRIAKRDTKRLLTNGAGTVRYWLHAASPNWRAAPASDCGSPCPGGRPMKIEKDGPFVTFRTPQVDDAVRALAATLPATEEPAEVRVVVFDTWPADGDNMWGLIEARFSDPNLDPAIRSRLDWVLRKRMVADVFDYVGPLGLTEIAAPLVRRDSIGGHHASYDVKDHGLFVADLIDQIVNPPGATGVPDAGPNKAVELYVYRVLTDQGPTDGDALSAAIEDALIDFDQWYQQGRGTRKLVMNFSLGFAADILTAFELLLDPPSFVKDATGWIPAAQVVGSHTEYETQWQRWHNRAVNALQGNGDAGDKLIDTRPSSTGRTFHLDNALKIVEYLFDLSARPEILVVAAAGNNSRRPDRLFPPLFPAALERILGVSAVVQDYGNQSSFSNADDVFRPDDGISALGGEVAGDFTTEGPMGLFVSDTFPDGLAGNGSPNVSGRAIWAGTSFATPIVAGIAARLWLQHGNCDATEILQAIVGNDRPCIPDTSDLTGQTPLHQQQ